MVPTGLKCSGSAGTAESSLSITPAVSSDRPLAERDLGPWLAISAFPRFSAVPTPSFGPAPRPVAAASLPVVAATILLLAILLAGLWPGRVAGATEEPSGEEPAADEPAEGEPTPEELARDAQLQEGALVYQQICSSCHQPGGVGLSGQYPPLVDNPNTDDADYVADVIANGRQGPITVAGETYDGIMPSFSTLTDAETAAVVAYIQNDFQAPQAAIDAFEESGPVAGTELPGLANASSALAFVLAAAVVGMVLAPRLASVNDRLATPWLDTWLKTAAIVSAVTLLTVVIPDWALTTSTVSRLSRFGQDLIGSGLWALGLLLILGALWWAHRESRV